MCRINSVGKFKYRRASILLAVPVLVSLGGCSFNNTARGAGDVFNGLGSFISGVGQDISLSADGGDQEVARRVNESGSSRFGNGTNASNASWTGRINR